MAGSEDFEHVGGNVHLHALPIYTADDIRRLRRVAKALAAVVGILLVGGTVSVGWFGYLQPRLLAGTNAVQYLNACIQAQVCPTVEELNKKLAAAAAAGTTSGAPVPQKPVAPSATPAK